MSEKTVQIRLTQQHDYAFDVAFGPDMPLLRTDEPAPLGEGRGPSPVQLLAAAVGNCLADSLLFALRKFKQNPDPLRVMVEARVGRNAEGRVRVLGMTVDAHLGVPAGDLQHLERVLGSFEAYCTVTQSVAQGIAVDTRVWDVTGARLK